MKYFYSLLYSHMGEEMNICRFIKDIFLSEISNPYIFCYPEKYLQFTVCVQMRNVTGEK